MEIREYIDFNIDEIRRLYSEVGWTAYTENMPALEQGYKNSMTVLAAYEDDELLGIIRTVGDGFTIVFIQDILVFPEKQRQGIGTALLKAVLDRYPNVRQIFRDRLLWFYEDNCMRKTETVELTVLCLIEDGNRILLQNRVKKDWQGYALPGGHVEPGESFVDAVIREMKEENGLTILDPRLVGVKQFPLENGRYVVLLFKATQWSGNLISSEEGQMEWIKYSDLSKVKTVDDFDDLLKVMNTPELTEFQYLVSGDEWTVSIR